MSNVPGPRLIRDIEVSCCGPAAAPHPARLFKLPLETTVTCPECGLSYRRADDWNNLTRATWPKSE